MLPRNNIEHEGYLLVLAEFLAESLAEFNFLSLGVPRNDELSLMLSFSSSSGSYTQMSEKI